MVELRILTSVYSQRGSGDIILERRFLQSKHFCHSFHNKMHVLCQAQCPIFLVTPKVYLSPLFICAHPRRSTTPCRGCLTNEESWIVILLLSEKFIHPNNLILLLSMISVLSSLTFQQFILGCQFPWNTSPDIPWYLLLKHCKLSSFHLD